MKALPAILAVGAVALSIFMRGIPDHQTGSTLGFCLSVTALAYAGLLCLSSSSERGGIGHGERI